MKSKGESGVSSHSPDPHNQSGPAWSASYRYEYTGNIEGRQRSSDGMSLPITSHSWLDACGSRRKEHAYEAILLWGARLCLWSDHAGTTDLPWADAGGHGRHPGRLPPRGGGGARR